MALLDQLKLKDFTGDLTFKRRPAGGLPYLFFVEFENIDPDAWVFDADGCVTTWGLIPGAGFVCLRPKQSGNTTGAIEGASDDPCEPIKYAQSFTVEVPSTGKPAYKLGKIFKNACDLVVFEVTNCCETLIHGIDVEVCAGGTPVVKPQLKGIVLTTPSTQLNTYDAGRVRTWTFEGTALCEAPIVASTLNELLALKTN